MANSDLPLDIVYNILLRLPVLSLLRLKYVCKTWYFLIRNPTFAYKHLLRLTQYSNSVANSPLPGVTLPIYFNFGKLPSLPGLPADIIFNILLRLSVKTLSLCKCVCKTWYYVTINPKFVEIHSTTYPTITSILVCTPKKLYLYDEGNYYDTINMDSTYTKVLGICGGLVCLADPYRNYDCIIGNLTIQEFRRVPSPKLPYTWKYVLFYGFSLISNDYKLVRIVYDRSLAGVLVVKAEVYTLNTDIWVEIDVMKSDRAVSVVHSGFQQFHCTMPVVISGVFYWAPWSCSTTRVMSFDISNGYYDEINVPCNVKTSSNNYYEDWWKLIEFEEKLSLIMCRCDQDFKLWVLNEDKSSWTSKLSMNNNIPYVRSRISNSGGGIFVVGYAKNGTLLLEARYENNSKLIVYNLDSREIKSHVHVYIQGYNNYNFCTDYSFYTRSLRSVNVRDKVAEGV